MLRALQTIAVALFILVLVAPAVQMFYPVLDIRFRALNEQRVKAPFPEFSLATLQEWPSKFDAYFQDHFGFRDVLVQLNNSFRYYLLGVSPTEKVLKGKDGWLFVNSNRALTYFRGTNLFTDQELAELCTVYQARRDFLKSIGSQYAVLVIPNKETIYPEYLPDWVKNLSGNSRYKQFVAALNGCGVVVVDPRQALIDAKGRGQLYRKNDGHWNRLGGFVAYEQLIEKLKAFFPDLKAASIDEYEVTEKIEVGELGRMLGLFTPPRAIKHYLKPKQFDPWFGLEKREGNVNAIMVVDRSRKFRGRDDLKPGLIPRIVVFRDSFFGGLAPFVVRHAARAVLFSTHVSTFDPALIEQERPNLVIDQLVERYVVVPSGENLDLLKARMAGTEYEKIGHVIFKHPGIKLTPESREQLIPFTMSRAGRYVLTIHADSKVAARIIATFERESARGKPRYSTLFLNPGENYLAMPLPRRSEALSGIRLRLESESAVSLKETAITELNTDGQSRPAVPVVD